MTVLTAETLGQLNADVSVPRYDRGHVSTGIVHIGVGNFHRSHQAMYIDTLMNNGAAMDWGICGIGLQPSNRRIRDVLAAQDERGVERQIALREVVLVADLDLAHRVRDDTGDVEHRVCSPYRRRRRLALFVHQ